MEPPAKRMRMSPPDEQQIQVPHEAAIANQINAGSEVILVHEEPISTSNPKPTRTSGAQDVQHRNPEQRGILPKRAADVSLVPRSPDVTVTANLINIAILEGPGQTSFTEITAPTTDLELPIDHVGTVKIDGFTQPTDASTSSTLSSPTDQASTGASGTSTTSAFPSTSAPANGTTSAESTVTVTATSFLRVSIQNTTVTSKISQQTVFTINGYATTIYGPDGSDTSGPHFGDTFTSSMLASNPTGTPVQPNAAGTQSSLQTGATPSNTSSGGPIVLTPQQQQVVGGVVGGVAGIAVVLLGLLYILKWYRQHLKAQGRLPEQIRGHKSFPSGDEHEYIAPSTMIQPSDGTLVPLAALKQTMQKLRPHSNYTLTSTHTSHSSGAPTDSERSFQRVSGRKIPSVLLTGGDGYGNHGPISPGSDHSLPRSRKLSQSSFYHESENSSNPFAVPADAESLSDHGTPPRRHISPFLDPAPEGQTRALSPMAGISAVPRTFSASNRSQLSIQTGGLTAWNPNRQNEAHFHIRPSPARTPTTASPTSSSLKLPMHTPPLMSGEIPEMPPLQPWRQNRASGTVSDDDDAKVQRSTRSMGPRTMSALSVRSATSVGGKFKEEI